MAPIRARQGKGDELEQTLRDVIPYILKEKGVLAYMGHRQVDDPDRFLTYEKYTDQEALNDHMSAPHMKQLAQDTESLLVAPLSPASIRLFKEVK